MVRAIIAVAALALAGSASAAKNDTKMYVGKLAVLEELSNKTDSIKDEAWELAAMKLNKTMHIADKVFEYKNKTEKALNLSKFEAHVDAKFDMLVDALNETKAKVDEPVKMVDEKVDLLKAELEEKLAMLKNKTFGIKEEVAGKLEELMAFKLKTPEPTCADFNLAGFTCPTGATQYCTDNGPIDPFSADQAKEACEQCYGEPCALNGPSDGFYEDGPTDCAGFGYGPPDGINVPCGTAFFGYQDGFAQCTGNGNIAGRIWSYCSSIDPEGTFGRWAPAPVLDVPADVAEGDAKEFAQAVPAAGNCTAVPSVCAAQP